MLRHTGSIFPRLSYSYEVVLCAGKWWLLCQLYYTTSYSSSRSSSSSSSSSSSTTTTTTTNNNNKMDIFKAPTLWFKALNKQSASRQTQWNQFTKQLTHNVHINTGSSITVYKIRTRTHTHTHACTHTCTHTYTRTHTCAHAHARTHTHWTGLLARALQTPCHFFQCFHHGENKD